MANSLLSSLYSKYLFNNPARERASVLASTVSSIPRDRYGYGSLAKIPMMYVLGKELGTAQRIDEENKTRLWGMLNEEQKRQRAKQFLDTFERLLKNPKTEGIAIELWNREAPDMLGINHKIEAAYSTPEVTGVKFKEGGGWWGIDKRTGAIVVWEGPEKGWRAATEEDMRLFSTPQKKIDRTVDLGDKVEIYYTDGTKEVREKGHAPTQPDDTKMDFLSAVTKLNSLYTKLSALQAGVASFENMGIPAKDTTEAESILNRQIEDLERWIQARFPEEWNTYRGVRERGGSGLPGPHTDTPAPGAMSEQEAMNKAIEGLSMMKGAGFALEFLRKNPPKLGPDGNWYVQDPDNPGRWLKIER